MPVTPTRGNACAVYTTQRVHTVPTASLASTGRLPDRAVTAAPATCWAQIPSSARLLTSATVIEAVGSAHASPMSRALVVTTVPPTSGTSPVAMVAILVPATQDRPEAPPAMSSQGSATAVPALEGGLVLSAKSSTGETLGCSVVPVTVTLVEQIHLSVTAPQVTAAAAQACLVCAVTSVPVASQDSFLPAIPAMHASGIGTEWCRTWLPAHGA